MGSDSIDGPGGQRRTFLKLAGAGIAASSLAGCTEGIFGDGGGGGDEEIVIGGLQPYTGPYAPTTQEFVAGLQFRLDEVNDEGGAIGREVTFVDRDTELDPAEATSIATEMIESEGASVLTGPISSDIGLAVAPLAEEREVPHIPQFVGSHELLTRESRYNFRMGLAPAPTNARAVAQTIEANDFSTVGAIIADYSYGRAWEQSIEAIFPDDVDVTMEVAPFGEDSFNSYLRAMPEDLEMLITASHPPGVFTIYQQLMDLDDLNPEVVVGRSDSKLSMQALGSPITQGFVAQGHPDPFTDQYAEVAQRYYDETGEMFGPLVGVGYVVADLVTTAIEDAGTAEPPEIASAIRDIELDTLFGSPIEYTEWGELDNLVQITNAFEEGTPEYYPDGEIDLVEYARSDPLPAYDPSSDLLG